MYKNQVEHEWAINISKYKTVFLTNEKLSEQRKIVIWANIMNCYYLAIFYCSNILPTTRTCLNEIFYNPIYTGLKELH